MALLKSRRNEVFQTIQKAGFDPRDFAWDEDRRTLSHVPTGYWFGFGAASGQRAVAFRPGLELDEAHEELGTAWDEQLRVFATWLTYVRRDEGPDLWEELAKEQELVGAPGSGADNSFFTEQEQAAISTEVRELKEYIRKMYELSEGQKRALEARLDYIESAASRLGRIDWWNLFAGALLNLVFTAVVPAHAVRGVLVIAAHALARVVSGGLLELPSG